MRSHVMSGDKTLCGRRPATNWPQISAKQVLEAPLHEKCGLCFMVAAFQSGITVITNAGPRRGRKKS